MLENPVVSLREINGWFQQEELEEHGGLSAAHIIRLRVSKGDYP